MAEGGKSVCVICLEESSQESPMIKIEGCKNCEKAASDLIHHLCLARYVCTKQRLLTLENGSQNSEVVVPCPHCRQPFTEHYRTRTRTRTRPERICSGNTQEQQTACKNFL